MHSSRRSQAETETAADGAGGVAVAELILPTATAAGVADGAADAVSTELPTLTPTAEAAVPVASADGPVSPGLGRSRVPPGSGRRFIVTLAPGAAAEQRATASRGVKDAIARGNGAVALESDDELNPFVVYESSSPAEAARIARLARRSGGVVSVEEDQLRYLTATRPMPLADHVRAAARKLQQATPMQPYGLSMVEATQFTAAQRSTTSPLNATAKFPICIIDSGVEITHPALVGVRHVGEPTASDLTGYRTDWCSHGTHVAGTVAGRGTINGVLPGSVDLVFIKVFDSSCTWTYASDLAVAMQRCAALGAKVISMSLAGGGFSATEESAANSLYAQGVLIFAAAGNAGDSTVAYPAAYSNVVSVAAIDSNAAKAGFSQFNADVELAAPGVDVLSSVNKQAFIMSSAATSQSLFGDWMAGSPRSNLSLLVARCSNSGSTTTCPSSSPSTTGRVCVIQRISTVDPCVQVAACKAKGGVAAIITNTVDSRWTGSVAACNTIPVLSATSGTRTYLTNGARATVSYWPYAFYSGTSMATPHASAAAALVWSNNPKCPNTAIRCALAKTARDLGAAGRDVDTGFGMIRAKQASNYLTANACSCSI